MNTLKTMNQFNLSKKEIEACLEDHSEAKYRKSDVKEFIRLLKEGFKPQNKEDFTEEYIREAIPRFIDKLAGDKLK